MKRDKIDLKLIKQTFLQMNELSLGKLLHASTVAAKKKGDKNAAWAINFIKSNPVVNGSLFRHVWGQILKV